MSLPKFQQMSKESFEAMLATADTGGHGPEFALACNATPSTDHVHSIRLGEVGDGLAGRVLIYTHDENGASSVYLAAHEARMLAAHLLNAADELDGVTPLVFTPGITSTVEGEEGEE